MRGGHQAACDPVSEVHNGGFILFHQAKARFGNGVEPFEVLTFGFYHLMIINGEKNACYDREKNFKVKKIQASQLRLR